MKTLPIVLVFLCTAHRTFISGENIDKSSIPRLQWKGEGKPGTYENYLKSHPQGPLYLLEHPVKSTRVIPSTRNIEDRYDHETISPSPRERLDRQTPAQLVLAAVTTNIYTALKTKIDRYAQVLQDNGYDVLLWEVGGGNPGEIKAFIKNLPSHLIGCVFIGPIASPWFETHNDFANNEYADFPCDLFYMDTDGEWTDTDFNGKYDQHVNGNGDTAPEIFVGRIDTSMMPGNEIQQMEAYLDKNYAFWKGLTDSYRYALSYTEDDWIYYDDIKNGIKFLYPNNYKSIEAPDTYRDDYRDKRLINTAYEFVQLACHSSSQGHYFTRGGWLLSSEIIDAVPQALGYNLFCCSGARFTDFSCLANSYIFNSSNKGLVSIGSTKTGSMLEFHYFYNSLAQGKPIGTALKEWFEAIAPYDIWDLSWHYGMVIMGDPMIAFPSKDGTPVDEVIFPPTNPSITVYVNSSFLLSEGVNKITWEDNPANIDLGKTISQYGVYRIEGGISIPLGHAPAGTRYFLDRPVIIGNQYMYGISTIDNKGHESTVTTIKTK